MTYVSSKTSVQTLTVSMSEAAQMAAGEFYVLATTTLPALPGARMGDGGRTGLGRR
jgi:hypothetical protein